MGRAQENQRLAEELAATREALRQVGREWKGAREKVEELSLTVGGRALSHSAQESSRVLTAGLVCPASRGGACAPVQGRRREIHKFM